MIVTGVKIQGSGYRAFIDGVDWQGIKEGHSFYQAILDWVAVGNTPSPEFTQDELDVQLAQTAKVVDTKIKEDSVRGDALLKNFMALGPDGIETYIDANSTNMASANEILKKLAKMLWLNMNRQFKDQ